MLIAVIILAFVAVFLLGMFAGMLFLSYIEFNRKDDDEK
jgi:hypothetical protein